MASACAAVRLDDAYAVHDFAEAWVVADDVPAVVESEVHEAVGTVLVGALELAQGGFVVAEGDVDARETHRGDPLRGGAQL